MGTSDSADPGNAQQTFQEMFNQRVAALAAACFFDEPVAQFRCTPNGPPVSPRDFVLCRYEQSLNVGPPGMAQQTQTSRMLTQAKLRELQALLDRMEQDITDTPLVSSSDVLMKYGAALASYPIAGGDVRSFVSSAMNSCFAKAQATATSESMQPSTELGMARYRMEQGGQP